MSDISNETAKHAVKLWKEAYMALTGDKEKQARLVKLKTILKKEVGSPNIKLRSEAGYQKLQALIDAKSKSLQKSKTSKISSICENMLKCQDLVSAGAGAGGPYVAIPVAALFLAFSFKQIYDSDKEAMFALAKKASQYTLYHVKSWTLLLDLPGDNEHIKHLRRDLHDQCVGLYQSIIFANVQLAICLHGGSSQIIHHLFKSYNWESQMKELDVQEELCNRARVEIFAPWNQSIQLPIAPPKPKPLPPPENKKQKGTAHIEGKKQQQSLHLPDSKGSKSPTPQVKKPKSPAPPEKMEPKSSLLPEQKKPKSPSPPEVNKSEKDSNFVPGPRNPLHWAVVDGDGARVSRLIQMNECPINALTPRSWTAAHLAAQQGDANIMKTILAAPGLNLRITNQDGHTPLHIAALHNRVEIVKLLLQRYKWLLARWDPRGRTASSIAAANGYVAVLKVLKEKGQNFNDVTATEGCTALHLAAGYGHVEAVQYLLANGANKDLKLKGGKRQGLTAKQVAEQDGKPEIAALL
ncbi:Ankyrin repeats (3 copies) [Pleosporales sp. CAS-2024a]